MPMSVLVELISGWVLGVLTTLVPWLQQRSQAREERDRANREEERAQRAEERAKREEERAQRAEDKEKREAAAKFLDDVALALACVEEVLRDGRRPPHQCGHTLNVLVHNYFEGNLQPVQSYLGEKVQQRLRKLKELEKTAEVWDQDFYSKLQQAGLTESEAARDASVELPAPVKESYLLEMRRFTGDLVGEAAGLRGQT